MRLTLGVKTFANDILTVFTFLIYMLVCDVSATSRHKKVLYVATKCDTVDIYEWTSTAGIHSRFQCHKFQYLPFNVWIKNKEARKNRTSHENIKDEGPSWGPIDQLGSLILTEQW